MIGLGLAGAADRRAGSSGPPGAAAPRPAGWLAVRWRSRCRFLPLFANSFGWIFTEMGRQPWVVFGLDDHRERRSRRGVSAGEVLDLADRRFTLLYGVLAVIEVRLMLTLRSAAAPTRSSEHDRHRIDRRRPRPPARLRLLTGRRPPWNSPPSGSS